MKESSYYRQAELAIRIIPFIYQEEILAIKGGTAINYFIRNLPRLSVDIDLTYVPLEDRAHFLKIITETLNRISERIKKKIPNASVRPKRLTEEIRKAFIVYLISHPRPMVELLDPNFKDIQSVFENEFQGMSRKAVSLKQLLDARDMLLQYIHSDLTTNERKFILSIKKLQPEWDLIALTHKLFYLYYIYGRTGQKRIICG